MNHHDHPPYDYPQEGSQFPSQPPQYMQQTQPPATKGANKVPNWILLGSGVAVIAASFMPWVSITAPFIGTMSVSGVEGGDGLITLTLGVLATACAVLLQFNNWRFAPWAAIPLFGGAVGIAVWDVIQAQTKLAEAKGDMSSGDDELGLGSAMAEMVRLHVGAGLWLLIAAGLVGIAAAVWALLARKTAEAVS